ncbi:hypothetical protein M9Y10_010007 [Tritrichomonas musculus]|uniref:Thioredoxin domain-containing protein n=1 Tax=Tritrichomonas musculus TaxID=1915356 RepID=A0ABR2IRI4_9EUKA
MLLSFIIISFSTFNFGQKKFNSSSESLSLPHIVFPYYPYQKEVISLSNEFINESSTNTSYVAASIDCNQYTTVCSTLELKPGSVFVSFPPHRHLQASNRAITEENIKQLASDLTVQGLYRDITTIEQLQKIANECPLFCLFARSNAGDLEVKLPIVERLAKLYVHRNVRFAFITEFSLYEKFARHPLTSFVFVAPSLAHSTQRGDFTLENLAEFVIKYEQPIWQELIDNPPHQVALTIVGNSLNDTRKVNDNSFDSNNYDTDDIDEDEGDFDFINKNKNLEQNKNNDQNPSFVEEFERYQAQYPMVFVNSSSDSMKAYSICKNSDRCIAAVDFRKFKSIIIPESASNTEILRYLREFNSIWSKQKTYDKISNIASNMVFLNFQIFCSCGSTILFLFGLVGLFFVDKKREIPDERKGALTKAKTK